MATFTLSKKIGDIAEPEILPTDWYACRICREPQRVPNAKAKEDISQEGAGTSIVINVKVEHDNPMYSGRELTLWLPDPAVGDDERFTRDGMTVEDAKIKRQAEFSAAFSGFAPVGNEVDFSVGSAAMLNIEMDTDQNGNPRNQINIWNGARPVMDLGGAFGDLDDSVPF